MSQCGSTCADVDVTSGGADGAKSVVNSRGKPSCDQSTDTLSIDSKPRSAQPAMRCV